MASHAYRSEYAKSGKASCKGCKQLIEKQSLRLAIMVQSSFFDGLQPNWFHPICFFTRSRPKSTDEIENFQDLRWDDQEDIRRRISSALSGPPAADVATKSKAKGRKRAASSDPSLPADINDYVVEYAKSSRAKCKVCEENIQKNEVRISKKDFESEAAKKYGPVDRWHHLKCFLLARDELNFTASGAALPGFKSLEPEDQKKLKNEIPAKSDGDAAPSSKVPKIEKPAIDSEKIKKQNIAFYKCRDNLEALPKKDLVALLEYNKEDPPVGLDAILNRLADLMTFGALPKCKKCITGQLVFRSGIGYQCTGNLTEWTKCVEIEEKPKRSNFKVPKALKDEHAFLASYTNKTQERLFCKSEVKPEATVTTPAGGPRLALTGLKFVLHKVDNSEWSKKIKDLGGEIVKSVDENVAAVVSIPDEISRKKMLKIIQTAKQSDVPVIKGDFFNGITISSLRDDVIKEFKKNICSPWGEEAKTVTKQLAFDTVDGGKSVYRSKSADSSSKSLFKSELGVQKFTVKDGLIVDPESRLAKKAHVYRRKNDTYSVVLSLTDLQAQRNSYYKLQLLESDKNNRYWVFRSWGRIGTTIGGSKTSEYATLEDARKVFHDLFEEKSGNDWHSRDDFVKVPGKLMMLDVVHGSENHAALTVDDRSLLAKPVQELITLIFDIEAMKKTMAEFEIDLTKMPLGKLSKNQISMAFSLLTELQALRESGSDRSLIIDRTNRFYTLVPHDFGIENPPILDNDQLITQKIDMLSNLADIEIAYNLLQLDSDSQDSPIDAHYKKLKADISVLDKTSEEFEAIKTYVQNTHAATHQNYQLNIEEVFKVERQGEDKRYKKFEKLKNKMLLWHGSRITNYAGILSQGLRIAPPEAPVTGYMFGKGIYFADMVSKSANYCMTSTQNTTGILLLCEVALGNMHELKVAQNVVKLPSGKNSVKGIGRTCPDPAVKGKTPSGAEIPYGKPVPSTTKDTTLLYNEFIVYDVNQVKINYCVRMNFQYGKKRHN